MARKKNEDGTNPPKRTRKKKENVSTPTGENMKMEPSVSIGSGSMMPFDSMPMGPGGAGQVGIHLQHNGAGMSMGIGGEDPQQMSQLGGEVPNGGMPPFAEFNNFYQPHHSGPPPTHSSQPQGMPPTYGGISSQQQMSSMPQQIPSSQSHFNEIEAPTSGIPIGGNFYQPPMSSGGPPSQNGLSNGQPGVGHPLLG